MPLAPALRTNAVERLAKGDLRRLLQSGAPAQDRASKERDGRAIPIMLVHVSDRRGATRAGVEVALEDATDQVVSRGRTNARGQVLLRASEGSQPVRDGRLRVFGADGAKSRRVRLTRGALAHKAEVKLARLPARAKPQALTPGAPDTGAATGDGDAASLVPDLPDPATEQAIADVEAEIEDLKEVLEDPNATEEEKADAREELKRVVDEARAELGEDALADAEDVLDSADAVLAAEDDEDALAAARAAQAAIEGARLALAREELEGLLAQYRAGEIEVDDLLAGLDSDRLEGLDLGRELFNQLPLDFAPEIFDLIVTEGLALQDSLFAGRGAETDFRRARTRIVKRFSLPRQPQAMSPDTRYVVRFRQEWAFLGYTLGGLARAEALDPGVVLRTVQSTTQSVRQAATRDQLHALREAALATSNALQQTNSIEGFLATATSLRVRQEAAGFASVGPRVSVGDDPLGGLMGGAAGALAGGAAGAMAGAPAGPVGALVGGLGGAVAGAAAGAFYGSGGRTDLGGDAGLDLMTRVNTRTSLRGGVASSLQVNSLLQSTQSLVDQKLRTFTSTLDQVERALSENVERVSPLLDRVTNLLRWTVQENYAVLTKVEDVLAVRIVRLTDLTELDAASRQALAELLVAIQRLDQAMQGVRDFIADFLNGPPLPNANQLIAARNALTHALADVETKATGARETLGLRTLGGGSLQTLLDRLAREVDAVQALSLGAGGPPGNALLQGALQRIGDLSNTLHALREQIQKLQSQDPLLFAPEDVVEYRRIFQPQLLEPLLAGRFETLRRDLELLRSASLPVHRIDVAVEHVTSNAFAELRVDVGPNQPSAVLQLLPGQGESTATLQLSAPVAASDLGTARFSLSVDAAFGALTPNLGIPGFPSGFGGIANPTESMTQSILQGMRSHVTRVRLRYHLMEGVVVDQVHYPAGNLSTNAVAGAPAADTLAMSVPRPAVNPLEDPLVRHVNRNRIHYLGLLMQAAMSEPSLRDDSPHLAALNGDSDIWQMPLLGFEGDRALFLEALDPELDAEALTWLEDEGAATLVQVPTPGTYGEALQGLLQLTELATALHPALKAPLAPVMPPLALVDLTGKQLQPIP